jgi:hypothetical protein
MRIPSLARLRVRSSVSSPGFSRGLLPRAWDMSTRATGTRSPPRILSRIVGLLAPLMSLNTATKKQSAISLPNYGTADRGLLVAGIGIAALMNLLGHVAPDMAMRYLDVTLTDLQTGVPARAQSRTSDTSAQLNPRLRQRLAGKARHRTGIRVLHEPQNKILIDNCNSRGVPRPVA